MLVSLVEFETVDGGNGFGAQVAFVSNLVHVHHVLQVAVLLLQDFGANLTLVPMVLVVGVVISVLLQVLLAFKLFSAKLAYVDWDRDAFLGRMLGNGVPRDRLFGDEPEVAVVAFERSFAGVASFVGDQRLTFVEDAAALRTGVSLFSSLLVLVPFVARHQGLGQKLFTANLAIESFDANVVVFFRRVDLKARLVPPSLAAVRTTLHPARVPLQPRLLVLDFLPQNGADEARAGVVSPMTDQSEHSLEDLGALWAFTGHLALFHHLEGGLVHPEVRMVHHAGRHFGHLVHMMVVVVVEVVVSVFRLGLDVAAEQFVLEMVLLDLHAQIWFGFDMFRQGFFGELLERHVFGARKLKRPLKCFQIPQIDTGDKVRYFEEIT